MTVYTDLPRSGCSCTSGDTDPLQWSACGLVSQLFLQLSRLNDRLNTYEK